MLSTEKITRWVLWGGLLLIFSSSILFQSVQGKTFLQGDCWYYQQIIVSLLEDGDLDMQNNIMNLDPLAGQLALGKNGRYVPKHQILMPLVSIPFYLVFESVGLLIFNLLMLLTLFSLIFKLNCLFIDRMPALLTTLMYALGTLFLNYAYNYSPDIFSTLLVVSGLYLCLNNHHNIGAILLGLSLFAKISNFPLVIIIVTYTILNILFFNDIVVVRPQRKHWQVALFLLVLCLSVMPFLATNWALYGSPFETGYHRTLIQATEGQGQIFQDHSDDFNTPFLEGVNNLLMLSQKGIVPTNPIILTSLLGLFFLSDLKHKRHFILFGVVALVQFVFFAKYDHWYTSHYSNRFLMTFVVMMSVFSGAFVQYVVRRLSVSK